jgi:hypothetical protein
MEEDNMTLRIALIASLFSFGCAKDEDSGGGVEVGGGACDAIAAAYCACDWVTPEACDAYEASIEASSGDEATCAALQAAFDAAGGCDQAG